MPALKSEAELTAAIAGPGPVVIDWYAQWCGKCRQIAPHVDSLIAAHKNVKVFKVDTDALPELAAKHNASVLPTFSFYKARGPRLVATLWLNALRDAGWQACAAAAAGLQEGPAGRSLRKPCKVNQVGCSGGANAVSMHAISGASTFR